MRRVIVVVVLISLVTSSVPAAASDPYVEWHSPFDGLPPGESLLVEDGTLRLNATIGEPVDYVEIERTYEDEQTNDRDIRRVDDLHNVTVHAGTFQDTEVRVRVFGEESVAPDVTEFSVNVFDSTPPTVDFDVLSAENDQVRLRGEMTDDTQPERLSIRLPDRSNPTVFARTAEGDGQNLAGIDIDKNTIRIDKTFSEPDESTVTVRVRDRAGNEQDIEIPLPSSETETETETPTLTATPTPEPTVTSVPTARTPDPTPTRARTDFNDSTATSMPATVSDPSSLTVLLNDLLRMLIPVAVGSVVLLTAYRFFR